MPEHPEDLCGRCGGRNVNWVVPSDRYNTAINRSEIVCPTCFILAHQKATGMVTCWELVPSTPFRWIDPDGRLTPLIRSNDSDDQDVPTKNQTTIQSEVTLLDGILNKLRGKVLAHAPDGWYAVHPSSYASTKWEKLDPEEQSAIERAFSK